MHENCQRHNTEQVEAFCRECSYGHCADCLVYVGGPESDPYCISCALAVAGVRGSRRKKRPRRERRAAERARVPVAAATPTEPEVFEPIHQEPLAPAAYESDLTPTWASLDERHWNLSTG